MQDSEDFPDMPDQERGLYAKYRAFKIKYQESEVIDPALEVREPFFLLKFSDDPHARRALLVYAASVETQYPRLARDIRLKLEEVLKRPLYSGDELDAQLLDERVKKTRIPGDGQGKTWPNLEEPTK